MWNLLGPLMLAVWLQAAPPQHRNTEKSAAKSSLTGCVDERDGQYVLTNDTDLQPTARLEPGAGSPQDNFAKHMGQKVTVRGKLSNQQPLPVMTVQSVETVSQTCAPGAH